MCEKTTYASWSEAEKAVTGFKGRTKSRKSRTKRPQRAYKCNICEGYHITSQKRKYTDGRRKRRM
jgi:hypothetical protein